jgi:hypothetical protein
MPFEVVSAEDTDTFDADFSMAGVAAVRARLIRLKSCSSTRYEAIDDLPAHIPASYERPLDSTTKGACLHTVQ